MASAIKKVNKISQIVRLKQVMQRWKSKSLNRLHSISYSSSSSDNSDSPDRNDLSQSTPSGCLAVYVGAELRRFVIPTRFLNLPVFAALLHQAEEEFGYQSNGGLVLPCDSGFFKGVLRLLESDEQRYRRLGLDEFISMFTEVGSCKDSTVSASCSGFTPLLQKTRV